MMHIITRTGYSDSGSHEEFIGLVEGDESPKRIIETWEKVIRNSMQAWFDEHKGPGHVNYPKDDAPEEAWLAYTKSERARRAQVIAANAYTAELHARHGKDELDALAKAGFKLIEHEVTSL